MKTTIKLEAPYSDDWKKGYLLTNRENRKTVILYNSKEDRSSTQYARYLMAVKLGRYLTKDETVDHIDEDKTNDDINNLQIISLHDNIAKHIRAHKESIKHGTYAGYSTLGCRCSACKEAYREYMQPYREKWYAEHREEYNSRRREKRAADKAAKAIVNN